MTGPRRIADLSPVGQELARLIPAVYLARDADLPDRPLLRLIEVLAQPLAELEAAVDVSLDDHFVERARGEVLPLLAELVGARLLGTDERTNRGVVAATVGWRRRKGTPATLVEVLRTTTGWATEVDEAARSLLATQDLNDQLPFRGGNLDLSNPVTLADPLSRVVAAQPDDPDMAGDLGMQLRRLGAADALRPAVSPRNIDLAGWARPERVVVRTSRIVAREVDRQELVHIRAVAHRDDPAGGLARFAGISLDPRGVQLDAAGRPVPYPLAAVRASGEPAGSALALPTEPDESAQPADPGTAGRADILTPTALALATSRDPDSLADTLTLFVDNVILAGGSDDLPVPQPLPYAPPGPLPVLRLADAARPAPVERWAIDLLAVDRLDELSLDPAEPATGAGDDNPAVLRTTAETDNPGAVLVTPAGAQERAGAQLALRVQRLDAPGYRRSPDQQWRVVPELARRGRPVSALVAVPGLPEPLLVRVERAAADTQLLLARIRPDDPAPTWDALQLDLPGLDLTAIGDDLAEGQILAATSTDDALLVVGPVATPTGPVLGVWRIDSPGDPLPAGAALNGTRIDADGRAPTQRVLAATCCHDDTLYLFGGQDRRADSPTVRADLWSIPVAAGPDQVWTRIRTRHAPPRMGGRLLGAAASLVLLGGAEQPGELAPRVLAIEPDADRPSWTELPPLPLAAGPGVLWARSDGADFEVIAWADRTQPRTLRLPAGERAWVDLGVDVGAAPNPPADDAAVFVDADLLVAGPVPLPPSEIVLGAGGSGHLAYLPALDPPAAGPASSPEVLLLETDGSTSRWLPPGQFRDTNLRMGAGREEPFIRRAAPGSRLGAPGRLAWQPLALRQLSLGPWDQPLVIDLDDAVGVDPRLGRVLLPRELAAAGRLSASFRTARAEAIGAGYAPAGRVVLADWLEPPDPVDPERFVPVPAPELDDGLATGPVPVTALLDPGRAGQVSAGVPVVARLADGIGADAPLIAAGRRAHVISIAGSPRLQPAALTLPQGDVLSVAAAGSGSVAHIAAEDGVSLRLQERIATGENPELGPSWFLTGLATDGAVEVLPTAGLVDIRWCDLAPPRVTDPGPGQPPRTGLRVAGALAERRLPGPGAADPDAIGAGAAGPTLTIWLVGCLVGRLEVPAWVQVIAAGCTFDAGVDGQPAIDAAGARLRLRHCTVRGTVRAGVLQASSCLLKGAVACDDLQRSWLRHSAVDPGAEDPRGLPLRYQSLVGPVDFAATAATDPRYLVPSQANPPALLAIGERGLHPGAHGRRDRALTELAERTGDFLPLGLRAEHLDRSAADLSRLEVSTP